MHSWKNDEKKLRSCKKMFPGEPLNVYLLKSWKK